MNGVEPTLDSLVKAARNGDPKAQCDLGDVLWSGSTSIKGDKAEAIKWYRESAKNDYFDAILTLGRIFDYDGDFAPNYEEMFGWYKRAADLGSPYAQYCVGHCYAHGHGVEKNDVEAAKWCRRSALQKPPGFSVAQHALGMCFHLGLGLPQDDHEAVNWFRKAADQGLAVAQYDLANAYRLGKGVNQDLQAAAEWYRKAAIQGDSLAQYNLGVCYFRGLGVRQNYAEATKWYRKAAEQGRVNAQFNLGLCYRDGDGTEIDWPQAYAWFQLAGDQGDKNAKENAATLANLMSTAEIDKANWLYQEFRSTAEKVER